MSLGGFFGIFARFFGPARLMTRWERFAKLAEI